MGKKVFEVARELGVDHRVLLDKCDNLHIRVRNYMSILEASDEGKLRAAVEAEQKSSVEERVGSSPGVRRSRRRGPSDGQAASRKPAVTPAQRSAPRSEARSAPAAPPATPAVVVEAAPAPAPEVVPVEPRVEPEPAVVERVSEAKPAPAPEPVVEAKPEPAAEPAPESAPESAPEREPEAKPAAAVHEATPVAAVASAPEVAPDAPAPKAEVEAPTAPAPEDAKPAAPRRAADGGPTRRRPTEKQTGTPRPPTKPAQPAKGAARVLGRIPLDQLQKRTRPQVRRSPGGRPPGGRPGGGRPPGRPGGGGAPGGFRRPGGPPASPGGAPPPGGAPAAGRTDNRRSRPGAGGPGRGDADRNRAGQKPGRKQRRVVERDAIYKGGPSRVSRGRKRKMSSRKGAKTQITTPAAHKRIVRIEETISVGELGKAMGVKGNDLVRKLMQMGSMVSINQQIDLDTAQLLAGEFDYEVKNVAFAEDAVLSGPTEEAALEADPDALPRAPVVTIMGHVDHGKTTLLDHIRKARVAQGEAGGITQHIGAYKVPFGETGIVFLDTPGHAAFTAMRARGAEVTDIVVLIVAADDGVMPQTEESINHAKAAGVPLVVAVNKCDKPDIDSNRIRQELTQFELVPEEWGGETMMVDISALNGTGVDSLLESLALQSEILELRANPKKDAYGSVVEARVDRGRGNVCTVLVREGTLKKGDYIVSGAGYGRVRALIDDAGKQVKEAGPSTPVEVLGLGTLPGAGDGFYVVASERDARKVVETRQDKARVEAREARTTSDPMALLAAMGKPDKEAQKVILKTDVAGSLEALRASLEQLSTDEVEVKIVHGAVGAISENDVQLAIASDATVIGFNVSPDGKAKRVADQGGVNVLKYSVIYDVIDRVKEMMSGLLAPEMVEEPVGKAAVRAVFHIQKVGAVAGSFITDGKMVRGAMARVVREGERIHEGKLSTLKRFKDDVKEVATGYECGIAIDGYKDVREGDILEVYEVKEVRRQIA